MTFEEAIEIIEDHCGVEEGTGFLLKERDLDPSLALFIIRNLEATYAPKIKMTGYQWHLIESCKETKMDFRDVSKSPTYDNIQIEMLAIAWLHPELIEVVE